MTRRNADSVVPAHRPYISDAWRAVGGGAVGGGQWAVGGGRWVVGGGQWVVGGGWGVGGGWWAGVVGGGR